MDSTGPGPQRVSIIDIDMPFWSMVSFMIKWAVAAVPAIVIISAIFVFLGMVLSTIFTGQLP